MPKAHAHQATACAKNGPLSPQHTQLPHWGQAAAQLLAAHTPVMMPVERCKEGYYGCWLRATVQIRLCMQS